jgi:predicted transporter
MVSAVAGVCAVLFAPCCALDPRLAALVHLVLGLVSIGAGILTWRRVAQGRIDRSNLFQARIGFVAAGIALTIASAWAIWISSHPDGIPG